MDHADFTRWVAETLRSFGIAEHLSQQIAECFIDEGLTCNPKEQA